MRAVSPRAIAPSIVASDRSGSDFAISWQRIFKEAELYWPKNTAKHIARLTGKSQRTAYRWLALARRPAAARVSRRHASVAEPKGSDVVAVVLALRAEYVARGRIFEQLELNL